MIIAGTTLSMGEFMSLYSNSQIISFNNPGRNVHEYLYGKSSFWYSVRYRNQDCEQEESIVCLGRFTSLNALMIAINERKDMLIKECEPETRLYVTL